MDPIYHYTLLFSHVLSQQQQGFSFLLAKKMQPEPPLKRRLRLSAPANKKICYTRYLGFEYLLRDLHGSLCNTVDTRQSQQRTGTQTEVKECSCRVIIYQNTASFLHIEQKGQYMLTNQESEYGAVAYGISYDYFTLSFFWFSKPFYLNLNIKVKK